MTIHDTYAASREAENARIERAAFFAANTLDNAAHPLRMAYKYGQREDLRSAREYIAKAMDAIDAALTGGAS